MENRQQLLLQHGSQINHHVPTTDEVQLGERRVFDRVLPGEHAHFADGLLDLIAVLRLHKKASQPFGGHFLLDALGVNPGPGFLDGRGADIGRENLDGNLGALVPDGFQHDDGNRIRFLARGTARHPDAQGLIRAAILQEPGKHLFRQRPKGVRVAEKAGHIDEQVLVQGLHLVGMLLEKQHVLVHPIHLVQEHAPLDAPADGRVLVIGEVHSGVRAQQDENLVEDVRLSGGPLRRLCLPGQHHVRVPTEPCQFSRNPFGRQNAVDKSAHDGASRHPVVFGRLFVLGKGDPALRLDRLEPQGAIGCGPRQNDTDGLAPSVLGQRTEEIVDRQVNPVASGAGHEAEPPMQDGHVRVRWNYIHVIRRDPHSVLDFGDRHGRRP